MSQDKARKQGEEEGEKGLPASLSLQLNAADKKVSSGRQEGVVGGRIIRWAAHRHNRRWSGSGNRELGVFGK